MHNSPRGGARGGGRTKLALCVLLSPSYLFLALPHCKQIQGAWKGPQAPAHCLTYQPPLKHIRGELMFCTHQQRPYCCLAVELCRAVGRARATGRHEGCGGGREPKRQDRCHHEGSETLPQDQQQARGQHRLCVPLEQHPMCYLQ